MKILQIYENSTVKIFMYDLSCIVNLLAKYTMWATVFSRRILEENVPDSCSG